MTFVSGHWMHFVLKIRQTVAGISMTSQFKDFLDQIFGGFCRLEPLCVVHARGARLLNKCTTTMGPLRTYCPNTFTVPISQTRFLVGTFFAVSYRKTALNIKLFTECMYCVCSLQYVGYAQQFPFFLCIVYGTGQIAKRLGSNSYKLRLINSF
jgi:hypothetical protein